MISAKNLEFLTELDRNNEREWFERNKDRFEHFKREFAAFHNHLGKLMTNHDQIGDNKIFRIYRDVRFSKDKTPYKTCWSGTFKRATHYLRGGYYYQIGPGKSYVAGGFFGPNSRDLLHIRKQIKQDPDHLQSVIESEPFVARFGQLHGEKVKTSPKGFSQDDPTIDLIRHKQFLVYE